MNNKPQISTKLYIYKKLNFSPTAEFQQNNKLCKFQANLLPHNKEKSLIPTIRTSAENYTQSPQAINNTIQTFYSNLHLPGNNPNHQLFNHF